jgi:outer membrane lipoprotein-sorting protein
MSFFKFFLLFVGLALLSEVNGQDALSITNQMFATVKSIKTLQYNFESKERLMKGKIHTEKSSFKINISPYKFYVYQHAPKNGLQCLYVAGKNNGKAKVNPNSFPWVNLNLDPEGDLMLEDRHHSIFDAGFTYTASLIEYLLTKYQNQKQDMVKYNGVIKLMGTECYYLTFVNPNYKLTTYTTTSDKETPISIAKKLHLSFYAIIENNPSLKATSAIKTGTRLTVPNDYASKMELFIHKDKSYPVYLKIYDNKGVYEEFSFQQVVINPLFKDIDFLETNPAYKF